MKMKENVKIIRAKVGLVEPPKYIRKLKKKCHIMSFYDLEQDKEYRLVIPEGYQTATRFLKLSRGTKLAGIVVYEENGHSYVDGRSNFSVIKAIPLF